MQADLKQYISRQISSYDFCFSAHSLLIRKLQVILTCDIISLHCYKICEFSELPYKNKWEWKIN